MRSALSPLDLAVIGLYVAVALGLGSLFARRAGRSIESFFVGGRRLPWWLAGTSIVATTFAADTPLAVTGIVAADGISGNWIWWSWGIAHLTATFFFARMWRRSGVITDAEITELRYGGRPAALLRGVKAVYFGLFVNCLTMAWVIAAMVKISRAFFDVEPAWVIAGCVAASVAYTTLGGLRSVALTDLLQFGLGMGGAVLLAVLVTARLGGIGTAPEPGVAGSGLLGELSHAVEASDRGTLGDVLDFVPSRQHPTLPPIYFAVLILAGWWRYAEGNGYIVQRLAACRDERHAQGASLWFAVAHNALRPWPWIVVALAALVVYPRLPPGPDRLEARANGPDGASVVVTAEPGRLDLAAGGELRFTGLPDGCEAVVAGRRAVLEPAAGGQVARFGGFDATGVETVELVCPPPAAGAAPLSVRLTGLRIELLDREMAYPLLMGATLPPGILGLVVASLLAAFMSTIDTHTNWGASYMVQDLYRRFLRPGAAPGHYVLASRLCVVGMAVLAGVAALFIHDIAAVWRFLVTLGAGLGSVSALRWYWPRVTVHAEFAALAITTLLALALELFGTPTLFGGPNPLFLVAVPGWIKILAVAGASLAAWVPVALFGPRNDPESLRRFASAVRPPGGLWAPYRDAAADPIGTAAARFAAGLVVVYGALFGIGDALLGRPGRGLLLLALAALLLAGIVQGGGRRRARPRGAG